MMGVDCCSLPLTPSTRSLSQVLHSPFKYCLHSFHPAYFCFGSEHRLYFSSPTVHLTCCVEYYFQPLGFHIYVFPSHTFKVGIQETV